MRKLWFRFQNYKFQTKIIVTYLLVAMVPMVCWIVFSNVQTDKTLKERAQLTLNANVKSMAEQLAEKLEKTEYTLQTFAFDKRVTEVVGGDFASGYDKYLQVHDTLDFYLDAVRLLNLDIKNVIIYSDGELQGARTNFKSMDELKENSVYEAVDGSSEPAFTLYTETVTFTRGVSGNAATANFPEGDNFENNAYTRYVKEKLNVEAKSAWETDGNNYNQKVALSITSGDIPDVLLVDRTMFKQMLDNDLLADVTDVYEACISDNLRDQYDSFGDRLFSQVSVDGRMYGIPATSIAGQHSVLWIRQDWLDKLGLEVPTTVEELEAVAKAFVEQDPGENGEGQTIGLTLAADGESGMVWTEYNNAHGANSIFSTYGAFPGCWLDVDGEVQYGSIQPEMKEGLKVLSRFYEEGILDKEFAVRKSADRDELVASGRVGILFCPWWGYNGIPECVGNDNNTEWTVVSAPVDENGNLNVAANDPLQNIMVIRKGYEHPEAIIKTLNVCYNMLRRWDDEGAKILDETSPNMIWSVMPTPIQIGYEDALERQRDNVREAVEARDVSIIKDVNDVTTYNTLVALEEAENPKADIWQYQEGLVRTKGIDAAISDNVKIKDVKFYGQTDTMQMKWANLKKLEVDTYIQIIMGEQPIEFFDTFVENWKAQGGDEITEEVNEECAKMG